MRKWPLVLAGLLVAAGAAYKVALAPKPVHAKPKVAGALWPLTDPFPVRPANNGTRYNVPVGNAYGLMSVLAVSGTPNINSTCGAPACGFDIPISKHARMQRWRIGIERQLTSHDVVSFGYTGAFTSDLNIMVSQSLLPASYYFQGGARPVNSSGASNVRC